MTADVSSLVRIPSRYNDDRTAVKDSAGPRSTVALRTRDLLGSSGCGGGVRDDQSLELDLDLQVPNGWEKRLDLKVRCNFLRFFSHCFCNFVFSINFWKGKNREVLEMKKTKNTARLNSVQLLTDLRFDRL